MHITHKPNSLELPATHSIVDAPLRISFIGFGLDSWESSGVERLDELSYSQLVSPLRDVDWLVTLQGHVPAPGKNSEQRILPRLKAITQPPSPDFIKLRQQLIDHEDDATRTRLLRGLRERLWHELYPGMEKFLKRIVVPQRCFDLARQVVERCEQCNSFAPVPRRPKFGAELAGWFGDNMIVDLFYLWGLAFLMMIDEAVRYKVVALCATKDGNAIIKVMLLTWSASSVPRR